MIESLGIMTRNGSTSQCKGAAQSLMYESIVCPPRSFLQARSAVARGCTVAGLDCTLNGKMYGDCICKPCTQVDALKIFHSGYVDLDDLASKKADIESLIRDYELWEQQNPEGRLDSGPGDKKKKDDAAAQRTGNELAEVSGAENRTAILMNASGRPTPFDCKKMSVCGPGVQQRSMIPLLLKDYLKRPPDSFDIRSDCPRYCQFPLLSPPG